MELPLHCIVFRGLSGLLVQALGALIEEEFEIVLAYVFKAHSESPVYLSVLPTNACQTTPNDKLGMAMLGHYLTTGIGVNFMSQQISKEADIVHSLGHALSASGVVQSMQKPWDGVT